MSKSNSRKQNQRNTLRKAERDAADIATRQRVTPLSEYLKQIEDRRNYHPRGVDAYPKTVRKARSGLVDRSQIQRSKKWSSSRGYMSPLWSPAPTRIGFRSPGAVTICIRRERRRRVLHALKLVGRGTGGGPKLRNQFSNISCKQRKRRK